MVRAVQSKTNSNLRQIVDRILHTGQLRRQDHLLLTSTILADHKLTDEERRQINRIFDCIQTGRIQLMD